MVPRDIPASAPVALSPARRRLFVLLTVLLPLVLLGVVEAVLRATWPAGAMPAFDQVRVGAASYLTPSRTVARRYFPSEKRPPTPPSDLFAPRKPARSFRVFVLGESSTAGFPYPHNGTFSRVLRDALRDVLPGDSVEVVNLGIAATNSYTVADLASDVIGQQPDAVLIYSGHNEYYGALGVGSTVGAGSPILIRLSLWMRRCRTFTAARRAVTSLTGRFGSGAPADSTVATLMETVARDQQIALGSDSYLAGLRQYRDNIERAVRQFRDEGVPVYLGSLASNLRDQPPFVSPANGAARRAWDEGHHLLRQGDSIRARARLIQAHDKDVVRFRAPTVLNGALLSVASATGARYVSVAERFDSLAPGGIPGAELFLEHVHPNADGQALIARGFFEALQRDGFLGRSADVRRLAPWTEYRARMEITPFDERIVHHAVRTVTTRWPFVERARALDYRGTYRPTDGADSLALLVSRGGITWAEAKLRVAALHEAAGRHDAALAEYRGLVRDAPHLELPHRLAGRALLALDRPADAATALERAAHIAPSAEGTYLLGLIALKQRNLPRAIELLDRATVLAPRSAAAAYQLSLAFGLAQQMTAARGAAVHAARLDPRHPGLAQWMATLGLPAP